MPILFPFRRYPSVFISYQRSSSTGVALLIHEKLKNKGNDAFLDISGTQLDGAGVLSKFIQQEIVRRDIVICLLSSTTHKSKWVRQEISYALKHGKAIIPVFQESLYVDPKSPWPRWTSSMLKYKGIRNFDLSNHKVLDSVNDLIRMILQTDINQAKTAKSAESPFTVPRVKPTERKPPTSKAPEGPEDRGASEEFVSAPSSGASAWSSPAWSKIDENRGADTATPVSVPKPFPFNIPPLLRSSLLFLTSAVVLLVASLFALSLLTNIPLPQLIIPPILAPTGLGAAAASAIGLTIVGLVQVRREHLSRNPMRGILVFIEETVDSQGYIERREIGALNLTALARNQITFKRRALRFLPEEIKEISVTNYAKEQWLREGKIELRIARMEKGFRPAAPFVPLNSDIERPLYTSDLTSKRYFVVKDPEDLAW